MFNKIDLSKHKFIKGFDDKNVMLFKTKYIKVKKDKIDLLIKAAIEVINIIPKIKYPLIINISDNDRNEYKRLDEKYIKIKKERKLQFVRGLYHSTKQNIHMFCNQFIIEFDKEIFFFKYCLLHEIGHHFYGFEKEIKNDCDIENIKPMFSQLSDIEFKEYIKIMDKNEYPYMKNFHIFEYLNGMKYYENFAENFAICLMFDKFDIVYLDEIIPFGFYRNWKKRFELYHQSERYRFFRKILGLKEINNLDEIYTKNKFCW